jgi:hypothetical protein
MPTIQLTELNLETLSQLGGGAAVKQIMRLLQTAVDDMEKRPGEERSRTVSLKLELVPIVADEPDLEDDSVRRRVVDGCKLRLHMDVKLPSRRTDEYDLAIGSGGKLLFNEHSPHNHRQAVFPQVIDGQVRDVVPLSG